MGHMARAEAREEQARINAKFTSTLVIAAAIIGAVRLAREDIALPIPRLISSVAHSISLARTILKEGLCCINFSGPKLLWLSSGLVATAGISNPFLSYCNRAALP